MILDCAQTLHHMLQFVLWVNLESLLIPDKIIVEPCGSVGLSGTNSKAAAWCMPTIARLQHIRAHPLY